MTTLLESIEAKVSELKTRGVDLEHTIVSEILTLIGKNNHSANPESEAPVAAEPAVESVAVAEPVVETAPVEVKAEPVESAPAEIVAPVESAPAVEAEAIVAPAVETPASN